MELTRQDLDQLVRNFREDPSSDGYHNIKTWYEFNANYSPDQEYVVCIYLFLLGANIRHRYHPLTRDEQLAQIKEIRDMIEQADPLVKGQRKTYLDYGSKSGAHR